MDEILAIDPVPNTRKEAYQWIDRMVARGFKIIDVCEVAGIPRVSYYMLHKRKSVVNRDMGDETEGVA